MKQKLVIWFQKLHLMHVSNSISVLDFSFLLKIHIYLFIIYLFIWKAGYTEKEKSSILFFHTQMTVLGRTGTELSQELANSSKTSMWVPGPEYLGHIPLFYKVH